MGDITREKTDVVVVVAVVDMVAGLSRDEGDCGLAVVVPFPWEFLDDEEQEDMLDRGKEKVDSADKEDSESEEAELEK